ncbi:methyltransferase [Nocardia sp. NPDC051832]|uniref:methyltransferase n=1 Tax=Nocardia sp. NPDC051832 TaxID=3155673 RepID=UPI00342E7786
MTYLTGKWIPPVLATLAELGVADAVAEKPLTPAELADRLDVRPRELYRVLRAAASIGVFAEDAAGRFGLTETARWLRSDVPGSLRFAARMFALEPFWAPYARLTHTVRTGEPAFDAVYGQGIHQYLHENPEVAAIFGQAASAFHGQAMVPIAGAYEFPPHGTIVDVGGGSGALLAAVLRRNPDARGILFDQEPVLPVARETLAEFAGRVQLVAGDYFAEVPAGDVYVIKSCLHTLPDDDVIAVLTVLRKRSAPVLIVETMIPAGNEPHYAKFDDIEMMAVAGGADRTEHEWSALAAAAGFRPAPVRRCDERFSLLVAEPC